MLDVFWHVKWTVWWSPSVWFVVQKQLKALEPIVPSINMGTDKKFSWRSTGRRNGVKVWQLCEYDMGITQNLHTALDERKRWRLGMLCIEMTNHWQFWQFPAGILTGFFYIAVCSTPGQGQFPTGLHPGWRDQQAEAHWPPDCPLPPDLTSYFVPQLQDCTLTFWTEKIKTFLFIVTKQRYKKKKHC